MIGLSIILCLSRLEQNSWYDDIPLLTQEDSKLIDVILFSFSMLHVLSLKIDVDKSLPNYMHKCILNISKIWLACLCWYMPNF